MNNVMAARNKLTIRDQKQFENYTRNLVYKCIQIIVQSRLGQRVKTQSRPYGIGTDWFALVITDLPEVFSEAKLVVPPGPFVFDQHVCVEISLRTAEGDSMVLETWSLHRTDERDRNARIHPTVYTRMGLMLKSLFCLIRATPAYRLSRRQGPDTYIMCYRLYHSQPQTALLGSGFETKSLGKIATPLGTINLSVAFRTKMLISPYSSKELVEDLRVDHFKSEFSPNGHTTAKPCLVNREVRPRITEEGFTFGESEFSVSSASPPDQDTYNMNMGSGRRAKSNNVGPKVIQCNHSSNSITDFQSESNSLNSSHAHGDTIIFEKIRPFVSDGESEDELDGDESDLEIPLVKLVNDISRMQIDNNANKPKLQESCHIENGYCVTSGDAHACSSRRPPSAHRLCNASGESSSSSPGSGQEGPEGFVVIHMKSGLTGMHENPELGQFYRDLQNAPPLAMFTTNDRGHSGAAKPSSHVSPGKQSPNSNDFRNAVTDQLAQFEAQGREFEDFLNSLSTQEV